MSRIRWVNHIFADMLYEKGYNTAKSVADADAEQLYEAIDEINKRKKIYINTIGMRDIKRCTAAANDIVHEIEFLQGVKNENVYC